ncbi:MAG: hypothetical protein IT233_11705 [Bacteroidia bacterium]|nr:hypothetical protein [Bacteroidia bacterium]
MIKKTTKYLLYLLTTGIILTSCSDPMERLSSLTGKWAGSQDENEFSETWKHSSETKYTGFFAGMNSGDTIYKEHLSIQEMGEEIFYIVDQNEEGPINFRLISSDDEIFIFENKESEFPEQIIYSLATKDTLLVQLLGKRDGVDAIEQLVFTRVQKGSSL